MKLILILLFSTSLIAAKLEKISFDDTMKFQNKELVLNGLGLRLATWFNVKVYVGGLYIEKKSQNPAEILKMTGPKYISMKFLRDVDAQSMKDAWKDSLDGKYADQIKQLQDLMKDINKGGELALGILPDKVLVRMDGKDIGSVTGKEFSNAVLNIYIGPKPPNEELKKGMLGQKVD